MKFKEGDYLSHGNTMLLRIIAAIDGAFEVYGCVTIRDPMAISWYTLQELEREKYERIIPNLEEFHSAEVGDRVSIGDEGYVQILAKQGRGPCGAKIRPSLITKPPLHRFAK